MGCHCVRRFDFSVKPVGIVLIACPAGTARAGGLFHFTGQNCPQIGKKRGFL
jgi:hypothetical protein